MSFKLFTPLFQKVDAISGTFITDISGRAIAAITPVVATGLTLSFIIYGLLIIRGTVEMPVMNFLGRAIRIAIITSIALGGGLYQSQFAEVIRTMPDELATALIQKPSHLTAAALIDGAADQGFTQAGEAFSKAGFFQKQAIVYGVYGVILLLATAALVAIGGSFLLLSKLALAILIGLGPLFIVALIWQPTARFFELWMSQVLNYVLLVVLFSAVFGLMMDIFSSYMRGMNIGMETNIAYTLGGAVILCIAMIVVLLQLPGIAAALAGGVAISAEARAIRSGAGTMAKTAGMAINNPVTRFAGRSAIAGGRATYRYFKGKANKSG